MPRNSRRSRARSTRRSRGPRRGGAGFTRGGKRYPAPIIITPGQTVVMQLRQTQALTSNGSGVVAGILPCDPSVTLAAPFNAGTYFTEWTNLSSLFGQVKCIQLECIFFPTTTDEVKGDILPVLEIGGSLADASTPVSYAVVADNTDSQSYPIYLDQMAKGRYHAIVHRRNLQMAAVSSPNPSTSIYAGCPGGIGFYASGLPINQTFCSLKIALTLLMQMRN